MSVGSVCVLGEPWSELLANRVLLLLMMMMIPKLSEGALALFLKEKSKFYFFALNGLNFFLKSDLNR